MKNSKTENDLHSEAANNAVELTKDTMAGDLIAATLDELKAAPNVWQKMSEKQQMEVIERVTNRVMHLVAQAVCLIAAEGRPVIRAKFSKCTIKDEIGATVLVSRHHPDRHLFTDSCGQEILIMLLNVEQFTGGAGDIQPDPDQPQLPLGGGAEIPDADEPTIPGEAEENDADDPALKDAMDFVIKNQRASISALQRALRIGYNRAARLIEVLERNGVVSPADDAGLRTVLVSEA